MRKKKLNFTMLNYTYVVASHARRHRPKNMSYTRAEKKKHGDDIFTKAHVLAFREG